MEITLPFCNVINVNIVASFSHDPVSHFKAMVFSYPWFSRHILKIQNKKDYYSLDDKNELQNTAFRPNFIHFRVNSENF